MHRASASRKAAADRRLPPNVAERASLPAQALAALAPLEGRIDETTMIALNAAVELDGRSFADVARTLLDRSPQAASTVPATRPGLIDQILAPDLGRLLLQHLALVSGSVLLGVAVGVPLGVAAHRHARLGAFVLAAVGLMQTVPSLALLAFLIALMGTIGFAPALVALFLYALLAGVSTAAVIDVGTATVTAFVGAGGLGERIVAGLAVNDTDRMLAGAIPAALLALAVQGVLALVERRVVPAPLRERERRRPTA